MKLEERGRDPAQSSYNEGNWSLNPSSIVSALTLPHILLGNPQKSLSFVTRKKNKKTIIAYNLGCRVGIADFVFLSFAHADL